MQDYSQRKNHKKEMSIKETVLKNTKGNLNPYNAGWPLMMDIVKPVMLLVLFVLYYFSKS